jgi:hypothetical protein
MSTTATLDQGKHFLTVLSQQGVTKEGLDAMIETGLFSDLCEASLNGLSGVDRDEVRKLFGLSPKTLRIVVDYSLSLEQMITAGKYDWSNSDITAKRFPLKGSGKVELEPKLFYFGRDMSSDNVIAEMDKEGFRPCTIEELLAIGEQHPELQRKFPLVALGSVAKVNGNRHVACLFRDGSGRELHLGWFGHGWHVVCRFPAVRK